jgi:ABC-type maltose transport system permease subunit
MDITTKDTMENLAGLNKLTIGAGVGALVVFAGYWFASSVGKPELPSEAEYMSIYQNMFNLVVCFIIVTILVSSFTSMGLSDVQIMGSSSVLIVLLIFMTIMLYV